MLMNVHERAPTPALRTMRPYCSKINLTRLLSSSQPPGSCVVVDIFAITPWRLLRAYGRHTTRDSLRLTLFAVQEAVECQMLSYTRKVENESFSH